MADTLPACLKTTLKAVAIATGLHFLSIPVNAAPDWDMLQTRAQLNDLSAQLDAGGDIRNASVSELTANLWPNLARPAPIAAPEFAEPASPADFAWTDKRIALSALAQIYGGKDTSDVLQAGRHDDFEALHVTSGIATLRQLRSRLTSRHLRVDPALDADVLRVPIVIARDATLRLGPEDRLLLNRADGAFLINFGRLEVLGGELSGSLTENDRNDEFVPFVTSLGSGSARVDSATLRNLGFGSTAKFSGFSVMSYPTMRPEARTVISNSRFDNLVTLALVGVNRGEVRANKLFDMQRNPLLVSRSQKTLVEGNLFTGAAPTNAIRVSKGSDGTRIVGNVILKGSRAGLLVSSGSDGVVVANNLIWRRNGGGIMLKDANCGIVAQNLVLDDRQKGVEVRSSRDVLVHSNTIVGNRSAGVWVSAQRGEDVTYVVDNVIAENGSGLSAASGGNIALAGNNLTRQFPRFLDGDITHQFRVIIGDLEGDTPIFLNSGGARPATRLVPETCTG